MFTVPNPLYGETNRLVEIKGRRKFTPQEDEKLKSLIYQIGSCNWIQISKLMPGRTAKQCRDRYCNYLSEPHKEGPWTSEEDKILLSLLSVFGQKWVEISKYIPGRSGSNVKNRWYKHLNKKYTYQNGKLYISDVSNYTNLTNMNEEKADGIDLSYNNQEKIEAIRKKYSISALIW
ncbi:hypothetical protein M9Y10_007477 [Tritrichomonas musculus]|uniref:Myb-like DNA-binding domain containing protein n=1 Tax=Tritrichomonas musculus TaxID=1915356 RepID=A0ABR2J1F5_9EUKA